MTAGAPNPALQPLRAVGGAVERVRTLATAPATEVPAEARAAVLAVTDAVEASLRRLLRDAAGAPVELRLKALAPDELPAPALIGELRQRERVSIELAAAFHDALGVRRRLLESGEAPAPHDAAIALRAADLLDAEAAGAVRTPPDATLAAPPPPAEPVPEAPILGDETMVHHAPPLRRSPAAAWIWAASAAVVALVAILVFWAVTSRRGGRLDEGIAAFRSGDYAAAAPLFERYAEGHPKDATSRLYLARIYRRTGRPELAAEQLKEALASAPEDAALHRELGFLLLDSGRADAAVGRFRHAIELDAEAPEGWIGLVAALRADGQDAAAERVLARAPAEVRALLTRGATAAPTTGTTPP